MAFGLSLKRIKKGCVCPICGHKDWCGDREDFTYGHIWRCNRYSGEVSHVARVEKIYGGKEGISYVNEYSIVDGVSGAFVLLPSKKAGQGANFRAYDDWYAEVSAQLAEFESGNIAYCSEHNFKYVPRSSFEIDGQQQVIASFVPAPKREIISWKGEGIVEPLSHKMLDGILRKWLECFVLAPCHKKKILTEWDISERPALHGKFEPLVQMEKWHLKTMPPEDKVRAEAPEYYREHTAGPTRAQLIERLLEICKESGLESPAGIPGIFFNESTDAWDICAKSGIIYPVTDVNGFMYRFRLGTDTPDVIGELDGKRGRFRFYRDIWWFERDGKPREEKSVLAWKYGGKRNLIQLNKKGLPLGKADGKYVNVSSYSEKRDDKNHTFTNRFKFGCQCGNCISVYRPSDMPPSVVLFTEGEKKSIVASAIMGAVVVCIPGVNSYGKVFEEVDGNMSTVETLLCEGANLAIVAFDADKETNDAVLSAQNGLAKALFDAGFKTVAITDWSSYFGKGLDDALLEGSMPAMKVVYR